MTPVESIVANSLASRGYKFSSIKLIESPKENMVLVESVTDSKNIYITDVNSHKDYRCVVIHSKFYKLIT